jgi:lysophospholipid acyltransferase (LPLAT)-like uncharacterized protein
MVSVFPIIVVFWHGKTRVAKLCSIKDEVYEGIDALYSSSTDSKKSSI